MKLRPVFALLLAGTLVPLAGAAFNGLIPEPQQVHWLPAGYVLAPTARIVTDEAGRPTAEYLAAQLQKLTGAAHPIDAFAPKSPIADGSIVLTVGAMKHPHGPEGYELSVRPERARLHASAPAGLFYAAQTFLQLIPLRSQSLPGVAIEDWPRFRWRGLMLDVSRHFYSKAEVERILDAIARYKLNTFHWHLTDDQGWRIEIKKYPRLTQVGAWRDQSALGYWKYDAHNLDRNNAHFPWQAPAADKFGPDGRYGGYYTQDDIREVVAYAGRRHITVVPEIEMPGHCVAALAAYPEFACGGEAYTTNVPAGINRGVYCPSKDETFRFLDDVLDEVFALFPGQYVHIGGDEVSAEVKAGVWGQSPACQALMKREGLKNLDELQSWFIRRIEKHITARGRTLVGWSEILQGGLAANAVVMDWIGGASEAARAGHDVVMSPTGYSYLDYYQSNDRAAEPHASGRYLPLEKVYAFEPLPAGLTPEQQSHILGAQANLWTEWVASLPHAEYMIFPRACAMAEAVWTNPESRSWDDFVRRLRVEEPRLDALGIRHRPFRPETAPSP